MGLLLSVVLMFGNEMLFTSWFCSAAVTALALAHLLPEPVWRLWSGRLPAAAAVAIRAALLPAGALAVKAGLARGLGVSDDVS